MDTNIIDKVKQLADSAKRDDGWTNLAALGLSLNVNNIDIKSLGYYRLKAFIEDMDDVFEISTDIQTNLPIIRTRTLNPIQNKACGSQDDIPIHQWSYIQQEEAVKKLKELALEEEWNYGRVTNDSSYPILWQYLRWTFVKLNREKKILYANRYAAFNTGLVDKYCKPVFALFDKNKKGKQLGFLCCHI